LEAQAPFGLRHWTL